jgi:hypothetical protein
MYLKYMGDSQVCYYCLVSLICWKVTNCKYTFILIQALLHMNQVDKPETNLDKDGQDAVYFLTKVMWHILFIVQYQIFTAKCLRVL